MTKRANTQGKKPPPGKRQKSQADAGVTPPPYGCEHELMSNEELCWFAMNKLYPDNATGVLKYIKVQQETMRQFLPARYVAMNVPGDTPRDQITMLRQELKGHVVVCLHGTVTPEAAIAAVIQHHPDPEHDDKHCHALTNPDHIVLGGEYDEKAAKALTDITHWSSRYGASSTMAPHDKANPQLASMCLHVRMLRLCGQGATPAAVAATLTTAEANDKGKFPLALQLSGDVKPGVVDAFKGFPIDLQLFNPVDTETVEPQHAIKPQTVEALCALCNVRVRIYGNVAEAAVKEVRAADNTVGLAHVSREATAALHNTIKTVVLLDWVEPDAIAALPCTVEQMIFGGTTKGFWDDEKKGRLNRAFLRNRPAELTRSSSSGVFGSVASAQSPSNLNPAESGHDPSDKSHLVSPG